MTAYTRNTINLKDKIVATKVRFQNNILYKGADMGEQIQSLIDRIVKLENDKASLASELNNIPKPIASVNKEILAGNKYHSICTMKFKPGLNKNLFDLKMISVEYKQKCVKFLGYSIDELENAWSIGKWFAPKTSYF